MISSDIKMNARTFIHLVLGINNTQAGYKALMDEYKMQSDQERARLRHLVEVVLAGMNFEDDNRTARRKFIWPQT